jgi:hypothetical protein
MVTMMTKKNPLNKNYIIVIRNNMKNKEEQKKTQTKYQ